MLRVAEHYAGTDTGLQRRANEDALLARTPLFVVADGMGGAKAGEVASSIAVESFRAGLEDVANPEQALVDHALAANTRIYELSRANVEQAGMGTTLTAVYVGEHDVAIAHVGDSRAYCLRSGELVRLTDDHSLVDEMIREGRLTPQEAEDHPQRSIITRALGPEEIVEVDTRTFRAQAGDLYLLCSDGLTSMVPEPRIAAILRAHSGRALRDAGEALIAEANRAGGRDNVTVILLRLEEVEPALPGSPPLAAVEATSSAPTVVARRPRAPSPVAPASASRRRWRRALPALAVLAVLALVGGAIYVASQSVYFIATDSRGLVTIYRGLPYRLPGGLALYSPFYVSGVAAAQVTPLRRHALLDHTWRSEANAASLLHKLEVEELRE